MSQRRRGRGLVPLPCLLVAALATGCQTVRTPEEQIASSNVPRELSLVSMPEYVIEPPDILQIEVLEALPGRRIDGERIVRADGTVSLGYYGNVYIAGLTLPQAKEKIVIHLRKWLNDEVLGLFKEGKKKGSQEAVLPSESDRVYVDVVSFNSKFCYVQGDVGTPGRLPITGKETVLDAIIFAGGLVPTAAPQNVRVVRPAPPGAACQQLLPVNLPAIVNAGDTTTNYQLMPGDRVVVYRDPIVRTTVLLERLAAPFQIIINGVQSFSFAKQSIRYLGAPLPNVNNSTSGSANSAANLLLNGTGSR